MAQENTCVPEYIEGFGDDYIITDIPLTNTSRIDYKIEITRLTQPTKWFNYFGARGGMQDYKPEFAVWQNGTNSLCEVTTENTVLQLSVGNIIERSINSPSDVNSIGSTLGIFVCNNNPGPFEQEIPWTGAGRIYYIRIYNKDGILTNNLQPRCKNNGEGYIKDVVTGKEYTGKNGLITSDCVENNGGISIEEAVDGVYILGIDNKLYTLNRWNQTSNNAVGVAVINSSHPNKGFVISKDDGGLNGTWGNSDKLINNILTTDDVNVAKTDFFGLSNTDQIISQDGTISAVTYCKNYVFPNEKSGYLPALGELVILYNNISEIKNCLSKIGGRYFDGTYSYWSSTQISSKLVWTLKLSNGEVFKTPKTNPSVTHVRAFTTLK